MRKIGETFLVPLILLLISSPVFGQNSRPNHWGIQADLGGSAVSFSIPTSFGQIRGGFGLATYSLGIARLSRRGSPVLSFAFSGVEGDFDFFGQDGLNHIYRLWGRGSAYGLMATKYFNFIDRNRIDLGLALGGGVGRLALYYNYISLRARSVPKEESGNIKTLIPIFETDLFVDFRPHQRFTIGALLGMRTGAPFLGGLVRYHFK